MPLSPRTLRPSSAFSPKSIPGLALWLDASAAGDLYQNSDGTVPAVNAGDPVGYWRDRSGNNRHATQATGGSRPVVGTLNSRRALTFDGSNDFLSGTNPFTLAQPTTWLLVAKANGSIGASVGQNVFDGSTNRQAIFRLAGTDRISAFAGSTASVDGTWGTSTQRLVGAEFNGSSSRLFIDGAVSPAVNPGTGSYTYGSVGTFDGSLAQWNGNICELLLFSRALTTAERQRIERYLAARWGIALAPQVSNADAQDWINRVYTNGGAVSASTAAAVNTFCDGCLADDIWAKMNTIGLLCGASTLSGAITPLKGGTFTNNNFVSGDYNAATGLKGGTSAQNKAIVTSLLASSLSNTSHHLFVAGSGFETTAGTFNAGGVFVSAASSLMDLLLGNNRRCRSGTFDGAGNAANAPNSSSTDGSVALVRTSSTDLRYYSDGVSGTAATNSNTPSLPNVAISVFARNDNGTRSEHTAARLAFFSIGSGLTETETLALHNRVATLRNAIAGSI